MPGVTPNEGETLIAEILYRRDLTDRDADLVIGLFSGTPTETTTYATLTKVTATGLGEKTLTDGNWVVTGDSSEYVPNPVFTAGAGVSNESVAGYYIATQSSGGTRRLLHFEIDPSGPYSMNENDTYTVDIANIVA